MKKSLEFSLSTRIVMFLNKLWYGIDDVCVDHYKTTKAMTARLHFDSANCNHCNRKN